MRFEFEPKDARVNMRLPESLLKSVKQRAGKRGIPYQRYMREMMELGMTQESARADRPTPCPETCW